MRTRFRGLWVIFVVAAATTGSAAGWLEGHATARAAPTAPSITIRIGVPQELTGATWSVITSTVDPATSVTLATGSNLAPQDGAFTLQMPAASFDVAGGSNEFIIFATKEIDGHYDWTGGYSWGLAANQLTQSSAIDAPLRLEKSVQFPVAAPSQSPAVGACYSVSNTGLQGYKEAPSGVASRTGLPYLEPTSVQCSEATSATPSCKTTNLPEQSSDCITQSQNISGVNTFRGYATLAADTNDVFSVNTSDSYSMNNGYRATTGPFSVSGSTTITYQGATNDTWNALNYCSGSDSCPTDGSYSTFGNDSWQWDQHNYEWCDTGGNCGRNLYENLYDRQYVGGTTFGYADNTGYYDDPENLSATGNYTQAYTAGSARTFSLSRDQAYTNSADVSVQAPGEASAYGSADFYSGETYDSSRLITNAVTFQANSWDHAWWEYDLDGTLQSGPGEASYFTCQYAANVEGGVPCFWQDATMQSLDGSSVYMYAPRYLQTTDLVAKLVMQYDGNLVLYKNGAALWSTRTSGSGNYAAMQGDGNLVVYDLDGRPLWWTGTNTGNHNRLTLQSDCNLVMYNPSNVAIWASNTYQTSGC